MSAATAHAEQAAPAFTDRVAAAWNAIPVDRVRDIIRRALEEDVGHGDVTTALVAPPYKRAAGRFIAKQRGILAGIDVARMTLEALDREVGWNSLVADGALVEAGDLVATCEGSASSILTAERTALNLLQRMSGIATITAQFVERTAGTRARVIDTRKTAPGLRVLDKYAVVCGGGYNHRHGLDDGILIKDNHIQAAGGVAEALERARSLRPHTLKIEIEVDRLDQIEPALEGGADIILLDNMSEAELRQAVSIIDGRALTEASGGVSLATIGAIAKTGADLISVGQLTHSPPAMDISLDFEVGS